MGRSGEWRKESLRRLVHERRRGQAYDCRMLEEVRNGERREDEKEEVKRMKREERERKREERMRGVLFSFSNARVGVGSLP